MMRLRNLATRVFVEVGIVNALRCVASKRRLRALRDRFGFDPWHASTPYWCRRYKQDAVAVANGLAPGVVVEVGCGLADIVSRIRAPVRYGMDIDADVLAAAREIAPEVRFRSGSLDQVASLPEPRIDLLVALNWLHNIDADTIVSWLAPGIESGRIRRVLLDEMLAPSASNVTHDFGQLLARWAIVEAVFENDSAHRLVLLVAKPPPVVARPSSVEA
jgi:SAM-dependent methyltransferase